MILQSFVRSPTVVLPFYPTGTMERVVYEGEIATANTLGQFFSCLPSCGKPTRLMVYDLHTLQNRFYLSNHTICNTLTTFPCMLAELMKKGSTVDCIAFPDDGANKRVRKSAIILAALATTTLPLPLPLTACLHTPLPP